MEWSCPTAPTQLSPAPSLAYTLCAFILCRVLSKGVVLFPCPNPSICHWRFNLYLLCVVGMNNQKSRNLTKMNILGVVFICLLLFAAREGFFL